MRRTICLLAVPFLLLADPAVAQDYDSDEQAVMGTSHALPDGVPSGNSDDQLEGSQSPDANLAESASPDSILVGSGQEIDAHSVNPDSITTTSQDLSTLPSASTVDQPIPAAIAPSALLPLGCSQPAGDAAWSACLSSVDTKLQAAQQRLAEANAAYSRSITMHVPTGDARAQIILDRNQAQTDVQAYTRMLRQQVDQAGQAGASQRVTAPYQSQQQQSPF